MAQFNIFLSHIPHNVIDKSWSFRKCVLNGAPANFNANIKLQTKCTKYCQSDQNLYSLRWSI